ncbi:MAG: AI-2E family transporter [Desulfobulbaceae bacterium]|nr:AI-2E family transporter [Desulfobulbaceae bacterium]
MTAEANKVKYDQTIFFSRDIPVRLSYGIIFLALAFVGWLHMTTLMLTCLFAIFALRKFCYGDRKWLSIFLCALLLAGFGYGFYLFFRNAVIELPEIARHSIPVVLEYAEKLGIDPRFANFADLKGKALEFAMDKLENIGKYTQFILVHFINFIIGLVIAVGIFLSSRPPAGEELAATRNNLYDRTFAELMERSHTFYASFATVMGAQLIISFINFLLTLVFLLWNDYPFAMVLSGLTFVFGLMPIVGNLLSNSLILSVGLTISPRTALWALIFLVTIHKLEFFLNSKIIGNRIKNPMWLTLLGLILGEKLMGIPGMILAPVMLHYIKVEASRGTLPDTSVR